MFRNIGIGSNMNHNFQSGNVRVYSGYATYVIDIGSNYPIGEIFERALLVSNRSIHDIYRLDIENQDGRWTWNITDTWWTPVSHIWNRQTRILNIYLVGWDQASVNIDRQWIQNSWNSAFSAWKIDLNNAMVHEYERRSPSRNRNMIQTNTNILNPLYRPYRRILDNNNLLQNLVRDPFNNGTEFINIVVDMLGIQNEDAGGGDQLTSEELEELCPEYDYVPEENEEELVCAISHEVIRAGDKVRKLPCHHLFRSAEIKRWLTTHSKKCPICRLDVHNEEQRESDEGHTAIIQIQLPNHENENENDDS